MSVKCNNVDDLISSLSGGNQQKYSLENGLNVILMYFLMDEPTRGIDILANIKFMKLMIKLANEGKTIIMVSVKCRKFLASLTAFLLCPTIRLLARLKQKDADEETLLKNVCKIFIKETLGEYRNGKRTNTTY